MNCSRYCTVHDFIFPENTLYFLNFFLQFKGIFLDNSLKTLFGEGGGGRSGRKASETFLLCFSVNLCVN